MNEYVTRATLYLIPMTKATAQKNSRQPQNKFKCPQCGKIFQNAQGLSGHLRYLHPKPKRPARVPERAAKQQAKVSAPAPVSSTGAHEHLKAAFAVLNQRAGEIDQAITRLEALKAERETVRKGTGGSYYDAQCVWGKRSSG